MIRIETERLILRTVTVDDAEAIFKWVQGLLLFVLGSTNE